MKKLQDDFTLIKYGLKVRLVNEDDAAFILSLRANPERTKYMVTLDDDINNQIKWIQEYKKREREGLDYYFIYSDMDDKYIGVNRISNINKEYKTAKLSSWIVINGLKYEAIKMNMIKNEIAFNILDLNSSYGEVHKNNNKAIRIFKLFGYDFIDLKNDFFYITLHKINFFEAYKKKKIIFFLQK